MHVLLRWIIGAVALFATVKIGEALKVQGLALHQNTDGIVSAFAVILILTLVNAFIRPVVAFFAAPLNCLTLGLLSFVINALMFLLTGYIAKSLHLGFRVDGFVAALFGSVVFSIISGLLNSFIAEPKDKR